MHIDSPSLELVKLHKIYFKMSGEMEIFFRGLGDGEKLKYPAVHAEAFRTPNGTSYLKEPGVVLLAQSVPHLSGLEEFLRGFDPGLQFEKYLEDPEKLDPSAQIVKIAGQLCYMSLGPKRTMNKDVRKYVGNLVGSGHGSVLEHPNFTLFFYGVSRSFTHELVRHRAGMGYSQESQRYVGGNVLRFVERPEFQVDAVLHQQFEERIDRVAKEYEDTTTRLLQLQGEGLNIVVAEHTSDKRKKVRQASRAVLTNEAEGVIVATGNIRAWRHIFSMRANEHAEIEIRRATFKAFICLREVEPTSFSDFEIVNLPDGTYAVKTEHPKV
mgnify:CR=1 FL=1